MSRIRFQKEEFDPSGPAKFLIQFSLSLLLTVGMGSALRAQTGVGSVENYKRVDNLIYINGTEADVRLEFCTPSMVRIQGSWSGTFAEPESLIIARAEWPPVEIRTVDKGDTLELDTGKLYVKVHKSPFALEFFDSGGKLLNTEKFSGKAGGFRKSGGEEDVSR